MKSSKKHKHNFLRSTHYCKERKNVSKITLLFIFFFITSFAFGQSYLFELTTLPQSTLDSSTTYQKMVATKNFKTIQPVIINDIFDVANGRYIEIKVPDHVCSTVRFNVKDADFPFDISKEPKFFWYGENTSR